MRMYMRMYMHMHMSTHTLPVPHFVVNIPLQHLMPFACDHVAPRFGVARACYSRSPTQGSRRVPTRKANAEAEREGGGGERKAGARAAHAAVRSRRGLHIRRHDRDGVV